MITYAEQFSDMAAAKARWAVLEQRQRTHRGYECIIVSSWLNGVPHVLLVAESLPEGFLDNPTGRVREDIDPGVWLKLWWRHEERRLHKGDHHTVIRRPANVGIRL